MSVLLRQLRCVCMSLWLVPIALAGGRMAEAQSWTTTWATSQLQPNGSNEVLPKGTFDHATLRQVVHLSAGGDRLRLKLSNVFGATPLVVHTVRLGVRPVGSAAGPVSFQALSFSAQPGVSIPAGAEYLSDALELHVKPLSDLVIDMEIEQAPDAVTLHTGARATTLLAGGYHGGEERWTSPQTFTRWYFLGGVEVAASSDTAGTVVAFGDSITDGYGSTTDGNNRWPDVLARRLISDAHTRSLGVANEGIGGNHLLHDGLGPSALARFDRDVLAQAGVRYLVLLEGINDLGELDRTEDHNQAAHDALLQRVEAALQQISMRAHEHGIRVYGATLTPYLGSDYYHPNLRSEADRVALNGWIRNSGTFDGVIDFDAVVRDPARPDHMLAAADSGDHLHPGPAGYQRMGDAIPLSLFTKGSK